jgi:hypothetical protein
MQEFDIVAGLAHPNIVRMFDAVEDATTCSSSWSSWTAGRSTTCCGTGD